MLMARVPESSRTSTLSIRGMLDTSAIFFLMYSFSVAFWKYLDFAILSTNLKIFLLVLPPVCLDQGLQMQCRAVNLKITAIGTFKLVIPDQVFSNHMEIT